MVDPGLNLCIGVVLIVGENMRALIGENIYLLFFCQIQNFSVCLHRKLLFEDNLPGSAVHDDAAIKRQNIPFVFFQFQLFCQRHDAIGWPAGRQNYFDSTLLSLHQALLCSWRDHFIPVGQGSVQIQNDHIIIHAVYSRTNCAAVYSLCHQQPNHLWSSYHENVRLSRTFS